MNHPCLGFFCGLLCLLPPLAAQPGTVTVYVSTDQDVSGAILKGFEEKTGIAVKASFDTEDNKAVGLANRIVGERERPRCDVFWNNEAGQSARLASLGLLVPYDSPNGRDIPAPFKDPDRFWTGFGGRARVLIYNTRLVRKRDLPRRLVDLADPRFRGQAAMSLPLTGTSFTHAGALYAVWGAKRTEDFYRSLTKNGMRWERGNAQVMRVVAEGVRPFGITDTDDAHAAKLQGKPTASIFLDQGQGELGTLVMPNTVMLLKGAPHPREARRLIDYLLSRKVERLLAACPSAQIPLRPGVPAPKDVVPLEHIRRMPVDYRQVGEMIQRHGSDLERLFDKSAAGHSLAWAAGALLAAILIVLWVLRGRHRVP